MDSNSITLNTSPNSWVEHHLTHSIYPSEPTVETVWKEVGGKGGGWCETSWGVGVWTEEVGQVEEKKSGSQQPNLTP